MFVEADTFRMGGHATHDVREARRTLDASLFECWGRRDPVGLFEEYLARGCRALDGSASVADAAEREARNRRALLRVEEEIIREVDAAADMALASRRDRMPAPEETVRDVYATQCEELRKT